MPYTMADFRRDYVKEHLKDFTPEERLAGMALEERLRGLILAERLAGLTPEGKAALLAVLLREAPPAAQEPPQTPSGEAVPGS